MQGSDFSYGKWDFPREKSPRPGVHAAGHDFKLGLCPNTPGTSARGAGWGLRPLPLIWRLRAEEALCWIHMEFAGRFAKHLQDVPSSFIIGTEYTTKEGITMRFRKSIKLTKGVKLNLSKTGICTCRFRFFYEKFRWVLAI